jgi:hypothetical protein
MYKILGADKQEYGPVSAEQIVQWINEGRANANTLARAEGSETWLPLSNIPEFASHFATKTPPPPPSTPPPIGNGPDPDVTAQSALARNVTISPGHCISRGWDLVMKNFWLLVGATFVVSLVEWSIPLLAGPCRAGVFLLMLRLIRGQRAEFPDVFDGFSDNLLQLFLVGLISNLLTGIGLMFCVIPGIYLGIAWIMAIPLVADKKMEFWPAMEASRKVMNVHWWSIFGLVLLGLLLMFVGSLVCCVGFYVAMPVLYAALAYAYEDLFGSTATPPTQPR